MKKIALMLLAVCLTMGVCAKEKKDDSKYLVGAVKTENGLITFSKTFTIKGMTEEQLKPLVLGYIKTTLVGGGIEGPRTRLVSDGKEDGLMVARVEEWMVFKKKFAYLDAARFRYTVTASVKGSTVSMKINQISYLYDEKIDDENGLNKTKTKLHVGSGKFRRKTCDRAEQIFNKMMDFFEQEAEEKEAKEQPKPQPVKKRKYITEE